MNDAATWIFTCPRCGEILKAPPTQPNQTPVVQMQFHGALTLQRHLTTHHQDFCQQLSGLIAQMTLALVMKCFDTSDETAIATRADLFDACLKTITEPWEVSKLVPPTGPTPQNPLSDATGQAR